MKNTPHAAASRVVPELVPVFFISSNLLLLSTDGRGCSAMLPTHLDLISSTRLQLKRNFSFPLDGLLYTELSKRIQEIKSSHLDSLPCSTDTSDVHYYDHSTQTFNVQQEAFWQK
ncbi:hypothetical protein XENORESO_018436 [Xenotaenia resolanae]|uniref:Uncharacterized protein n=1 Tax=Xenotaenia resolanae TaxID=208358 RepID=A0ABV0X970_9TELE